MESQPSNVECFSIRSHPGRARRLEAIKEKFGSTSNSEALRRSVYFMYEALDAEQVKFVKDGFEERVVVR